MATVTSTPRTESGPDSNTELHFLASLLRNYRCERERNARLAQSEGMKPESRQEKMTRTDKL